MTPADLLPRGGPAGTRTRPASSAETAAPAWYWRIPYAIAVALVGAVLVLGWVKVPPDTTLARGNHYVLLADSLVHGHLWVDASPGDLADLVIHNGRTYVPLGPLPAVLLIPFLPFISPDQAAPGPALLLVPLSVWLCVRILRTLGVDGNDQRWAVLAFFGGTAYLAVAAAGGSAYYLAHLVAVACLLAAIWSQLSGRHPWLTGLLLGAAGMTRLTVLFTLPFFVWLELRASLNWRSRQLRWSTLVIRLGQLALGLVPCLLVLAAYNQARFGNMFDSGYGIADLGSPELQAARALGLFSLVHVPKNLFVFFLQGPFAYPSITAPSLQPPYLVPSQWGMGIIFTSPWLFSVLRASWRGTLVQACWLGALCGAVPILTYYGIGPIQFGYRYALDFLLLLFLAAVASTPVLRSPGGRALILASTLVNVWGSLFLLSWL